MLVACALAPVLAGQERLQVDFPEDSPVTVLSADWGSSRAESRGGAMQVTLSTSLRLRNVSQNTIRGITLLVLAQEMAPGGKASVSVPSLNVAPGDAFPVRMDLRLLRPLLRGSGPLVRVSIDGVLFEDLSFFGPDQLHSRRSMTVWEMQARRDRTYLKSVLAAKGPEALREEALASLNRQAERPRLNVQVARRGRATVFDGAREVKFAFVRFPGAPVEPLAGMARLLGREAGGASVEVRNRSAKPVSYVEVGWLVSDRAGNEYLAGSLPAKLSLQPGGRIRIATDTTLRFPVNVAVDSMRGFVNKVEFSDGDFWIPSRDDLGNESLDALLMPSPEEQRLTNLYRKKGLDALVLELSKF